MSGLPSARSSPWPWLHSRGMHIMRNRHHHGLLRIHRYLHGHGNGRGHDDHGHGHARDYVPLHDCENLHHDNHRHHNRSHNYHQHALLQENVPPHDDAHVRDHDCAHALQDGLLHAHDEGREYVQLLRFHGLIFVHPVVHDQISSHDKMCIEYPLIVAQLSAIDSLHVKPVFEVDIVAQLPGYCNTGAVGHVLTIHVTLYDNAKICHALSLIYPVQDSF